MTRFPSIGARVRWNEEEAIVVAHEDGSLGRKEPRLVLYIVRSADIVSLPASSDVEAAP
jgi:hypothetical protein